MDRRRFLVNAVHASLAAAAYPFASAAETESGMEKRSGDAITLFVCGDVMTGRGIDQILPHPGDPAIHEPYVKSALGYVRLAEKVNGPIERPVDFAYIWGTALEDLERAKPDLRIVNLETSVTANDDHWPGKGIHYRMHPRNVPCLTAAGIDCCALGNNHVLDWGYAGLDDTLRTLDAAGIATAGAGADLASAQAPAVFDLPAGRVLVFAAGADSSGIPRQWGATAERAGVHRLDDVSETAAARLAELIGRHRQDGDLVVVSLHWGGNWGYDVPAAHTRFAHRLIDTGRVDAIHGHSSHHPLGIEVYRERPILYGCGDLLNDYEGIPGYESYRGNLSLLYFLRFDAAAGRLVGLDLAPQQVRRFRLQSPGTEDVEWLRDRLDRECRKFGTRVEIESGDRLSLRW